MASPKPITQPPAKQVGPLRPLKVRIAQLSPAEKKQLKAQLDYNKKRASKKVWDNGMTN